jgi:hypothetical protein
VTNLDQLTDVNTATPAPTAGQVLTWSAAATQWVPVSLPAWTPVSVDALTDVDTVTAPPANGQVLTWNATSALWVPAPVPADLPQSINWLTDVDTATAPPGAGQTLIWNPGTSQWTPGLPTMAINTLTDVDTVTTPPADGNILIWSGASSNWEPRPRVASLDQLTDVDTATVPPVNGAVLTWDQTQTQWEPAPIPAQPINALTDVDTVTTPPTNGQVLAWDATAAQWEPTPAVPGPPGTVVAVGFNVRKSAAQSVPNNAFTLATYDNIIFDSDSAWNGSSYTIPRPGFWLFGAYMQWAVVGGGVRFIGFFGSALGVGINNALFTEVVDAAADSNGRQSTSLGPAYIAAAGGAVSVCLYQSSGAPLNTVSGVQFSLSGPWMGA